jgi:hypothetical protein
MPPQRSVVLDAERGEHASGEPVGVMLAGHGKLNDLLPDQLGHLVSRGRGELELGAHSLEGPVHGLNVVWLERESTGRGPYHQGAADVWSWPPTAISHSTSLCPQICDKHEELKAPAGATMIKLICHTSAVFSTHPPPPRKGGFAERHPNSAAPAPNHCREVATDEAAWIAGVDRP